MARLQVDVDVNVNGANQLQTLGGNLQRTGLNLTKFVTAPLVGIGVAATVMAADAEKAGAKLQASFKSMEAARKGFSLKGLEAQAEALGQLSSFDDDEIKEAQATLLTFGNVTGEAFDKGLEGAIGMSELLGQDLQSSIIQVGKALNDPIKGVGALSRVGVSFTQQQKDQIAAMTEVGDVAGAQAIILGELDKQFGAVTETLAATDTGKTAQALEDLGNAGEQLGSVFLPVMAKAAQFVSGLAQAFLGLDPGMQQFIATVGVVVAAIGPVVFVVGKLISSFQAVIGVFNLLKLALLTNPFTALALAVAAIAALIILNWDKIWAFLSGVWNKIKEALSGLADFFSDAWEGIANAATAAWTGISNIIKGAINGVIDVINGLFGFLNGIQIGIPEINVGPVHVGGGVIDPFNIGLIPHLAEGGIIDGPTLALIGERGPEAVVPLDRQGVGGNHFHSHIDVRGEDPFIRNEEDLIRTQQRVAFLAGFS